jgi:hypothetical protein
VVSLHFNVEGVAGLSDAPRPGAPAKVTPGYVKRLLVVRQHPRSMDQPYWMWTLISFLMPSLYCQPSFSTNLCNCTQRSWRSALVAPSKYCENWWPLAVERWIGKPTQTWVFVFIRWLMGKKCAVW